MKIWKKVKNPCDQDDLQMGLDKLFEWSVLNKMKFLILPVQM